MLNYIQSLQVRNYRVLKRVDIELDEDLQVLVGPNGSGKSTMFDAINFVFELLTSNVGVAVQSRTANFQDLVWNRSNPEDGFEIALEVFCRSGLTFRYEVKVQETESGVKVTKEQAFVRDDQKNTLNDDTRSDSVVTNNWEELGFTPVFLSKLTPGTGDQQTEFYAHPASPDSVIPTVQLAHGEHAIQIAEIINGLNIWERGGKRERSTTNPMGPIIDDIRYLGAPSIHFLQLDSRMLKKASPMNGGEFSRLSSNGQNLPWLVDRFKQNDPKRFSMWIEHLRSLLDHLEDVDTREREDDRHRYLLITTTDGVAVPSWGASEGTLRLIALTLLAYYKPVSDPPLAYLVEEPENGIHPLAVEGAYQSLSSVYSSQVFIASHSPTLLQSAKPKNVLCFSRSTEGVKITPGHKHPYLKDWQGNPPMDVFFATDILT